MLFLIPVGKYSEMGKRFPMKLSEVIQVGDLIKASYDTDSEWLFVFNLEMWHTGGPPLQDFYRLWSLTRGWKFVYAHSELGEVHKNQRILTLYRNGVEYDSKKNR